MKTRCLAIILALGLALPLSAQGRRVVLAIDGSGSMKEPAASSGLSVELGNLMAQLHPDDELAVIVFDDAPALVRIPALLGPSTSPAIAQVQGLQYDGKYSDLPAALAMACDVYPDGSVDAPVDVILITDGVVTVRAPRVTSTAIAEMKETILPRCVASGARIHVLGLGGEKANTAILQSLAEASGGRSEFPLSAARLSSFLSSYIATTTPPPPPPKVVESAIATPTDPAEPAPARGMLFLGLAALGLLLTVLIIALALRRRRTGGVAMATGPVTVRELVSGTEHVLHPPVTLGRSPSSPIRLDNNEASRRHFRLEMHEGKVAVVDLGSSNGTFVNGTRLKEGEPRIMRPGDTVKIPGLELVIQPTAMDLDSTYIRQDLDGTFIRPSAPEAPRR